MTPSPGLGGVSSAHELGQPHFPGRLSAPSQDPEFRQNFWRARLPQPPVSLGSGPSQAVVLPCSLGSAPTRDPWPAVFEPCSLGAGALRDRVIPELGPPCLPALSCPGAPLNQRHPEDRGMDERMKEGRNKGAPCYEDPHPPLPRSPPTCTSLGKAHSEHGKSRVTWTVPPPGSPSPGLQHRCRSADEAWPSPPLSCSAHARTSLSLPGPTPVLRAAPSASSGTDPTNQSLRPAGGPPSNPPGPIFWAQGALVRRGCPRPVPASPPSLGIRCPQPRRGPALWSLHPHLTPKQRMSPQWSLHTHPVSPGDRQVRGNTEPTFSYLRDPPLQDGGGLGRSPAWGCGTSRRPPAPGRRTPGQSTGRPGAEEDR